MALNSTCTSTFNPSTFLSTIEHCQSEAKTPYCWPPNGTRICVPSGDIPFYWPESSYNPDSSITIDYGRSDSRVSRNVGMLSSWLKPFRLDRGVYEDVARGGAVKGERELTFWIKESFAMGGERVVEGPTVVLVNLDEKVGLPSLVPGRPDEEDDDDDDDDDEGKIASLGAGAIVGIVFGILIAVIGSVLVCCRNCACCRRNSLKRTHVDEQQETDAEKTAGVAVTAPVANTALGTDEIRVLGEQESQQEVGRAKTSQLPVYEAPPKYTP